MTSDNSNKVASKLGFAGIYAVSIALIMFILFPFLEGNSTNVTLQKAPVLPVVNPVQQDPDSSLRLDLQKSLTAVRDSLDAYKKSLAQYQNNLAEKNEQIATLQTRVNTQQQTPTVTTQVRTVVNTEENDKLKSRITTLEKKNAALIDLNNDLKRSNEFLAAQVNSLKGK